MCLCVFFLLIIEPLFDRACHRLVTTISLFGDMVQPFKRVSIKAYSCIAWAQQARSRAAWGSIPDERAPARTAGGIEEYFYRVVQFSALGGSSTRPGKQQRAALA